MEKNTKKLKKNPKAFKKAAENCSHFTPSEESSQRAKNSTNPEHTPDVSCKNCEHYEPSSVCALNLYREILDNHQI